MLHFREPRLTCWTREPVVNLPAVCLHFSGSTYSSLKSSKSEMYSKTKFKGYTHTQTRNFFFVRSVLETRFARITTTVPLLLLNNYCGTLGTKVSSYSQMYTTTKTNYFRVKISAPFSGATVNLLDEGTSSKLAVIWPGSVTVGQTL